MDREAWQARVHEVTKSQTQTVRLGDKHTHKVNSACTRAHTHVHAHTHTHTLSLSLSIGQQPSPAAGESYTELYWGELHCLN